MKIDPYKHKEVYLNWKEKVKDGISEVNKENSNLILQYIGDMEYGINISTGNRKGARSYSRLNNLRQRMVFLAKAFQNKFEISSLVDVTERELHEYFALMRKGVITTKTGKKYKSTADYIKVFKAFWHWHQKVNRKEGKDIQDITIDLDTRTEKPKWVYLTEDQIKELCNKAKYEYKVLIMFLFDSGIRSPTELINIRVSDLYNDCKELHIRDEISKTFGRKIKLMFCSELLKGYISSKELGEDDQVFGIYPASVNQYLRRLSERVFGKKESLAGETYDKLTMYDFRHCSCCYWLPRYKSESALKFRFGWKKSDKIHYYSEMLGMRDTIQEEDMLVDVTKTELEKRLTKTEHENEMMKDEMKALREQSQKMMELVQNLQGNIIKSGEVGVFDVV